VDPFDVSICRETAWRSHRLQCFLHCRSNLSKHRNKHITMSNKILIGTWRARCSALVAIVVRESSFVNLSRPLFSRTACLDIPVPSGCRDNTRQLLANTAPMSATVNVSSLESFFKVTVKSGRPCRSSCQGTPIDFHVVYHGVPHGESRVVSRGPMSATWMFEGESGQQHNKAEHVGHDVGNVLF